MAPSSPTVSLLEFRLRIRKRRDELGISAEDVRKHLNVSRVYYSSIENGRAILSDAKLDPLLSILELEDQTEELGTLLSESRIRGWWQDYAGVLSPTMIDFLGLEHGAARARITENRVVTGLMQTREYAEALMRASSDISLLELNDFLEVRMRRKQRLSPPDPLEVDLVVSETVLMQQYGDVGVLCRQLRSLLDVIEHEDLLIKFQIQPFDLTPIGGGGTSTSVLLDFESEHIPTVSLTETSGPSELRFAEEEVKIEAINFGLLRDSTLSMAESLDMLRRRISELNERLPPEREL